MSDERDFETEVRRLCAEDGRYAPAAYHFLLEGLDYTIKLLGREKAQGIERHVGGVELLDGIRRYALLQLGPMARFVFESWGVRRTEDFGSIVFRLIEAGLLSRQESDSLQDFVDVFDFREAFDRGYRIETRDLEV